MAKEEQPESRDGPGARAQGAGSERLRAHDDRVVQELSGLPGGRARKRIVTELTTSN